MTKGKLSVKPRGNLGGERGSHTRSFSPLSPNIPLQLLFVTFHRILMANGEGALASYDLPLRNLFTPALK